MWTTDELTEGRAKLRDFPRHCGLENTQPSPSFTPTLGMSLPVPGCWSKTSQYFGCCKADSQADEDQNQLNNNLKIEFFTPKFGVKSLQKINFLYLQWVTSNPKARLFPLSIIKAAAWATAPSAATGPPSTIRGERIEMCWI